VATYNCCHVSHSSGASEADAPVHRPVGAEVVVGGAVVVVGAIVDVGETVVVGADVVVGLVHVGGPGWHSLASSGRGHAKALSFIVHPLPDLLYCANGKSGRIPLS
jgi:hypothetical protein